MDKLFIVQSELDNSDTDGYIIRKLLKHYTPITCDKWCECSSSDGYIKNYIGREDVVPIGDIPFVESFLPDGYHISPIEIPECLGKYTGRLYGITDGYVILREAKTIDLDKFFVKDATCLKSWNNLLYDGADISRFIIPEHKYVVSDRVDFLSEYRVFVLNDEVVGAPYYLGDPTVFPNGETVRAMVREYKQDKNRPAAYTLDVGIIKAEKNGYEYEQTVPIEVHPFAACGLYGIEDMSLLKMYELGWEWCRKNCRKDVKCE